MSFKEKVIRELRRGYSPLGIGPKENLNSIFNETFKPLTVKKDLDFFFDLTESDEINLRSWGYLGVYHILKDKKDDKIENKERFHKIIFNLLNDKSELKYLGSKDEVITTLREHHARRIYELDPPLIFEPVYNYIQSYKGEIDDIIVELIENILAKVQDPKSIPLILDCAKSIDQTEFNLILHIIRAFEIMGKNMILSEKKAIGDLFKHYLEDIDNFKKNLNKKEEIDNKILKNLEEELLKVGAVLNLDLKEDTLDFLSKLTYPYKDLHQIALVYKNDEKFKLILLDKLEEIENPNLVKDILMAIIAMKENIGNWRELIIEYLNKFQLVDNDLIEELQKVELFNEEMLVDFLNEGENWQLDFIREYLISNPQIFNTWSKLQDEFIEILKFFKSPEENWDKYPNMKNKKGMILKLIIDLEIQDLLKYSIDNVKNLEDKTLREIALFSIIKIGNEGIMLEFKKQMKNDKELAEFFKKFWRYLERREFKFYY